MKERAEPISSSQVVKLNGCDPTISRVGGQSGHPLIHLGKGNGNRVQWPACAQCADGNGRLGTTGFC